MRNIEKTCCCALVALGVGLLGSDARGQFGAPEPTPSAGQPPADRESQQLCHCLGEGNAASVERIHQALRGPLHADGLDFNAAPIEDVINVLQEEYNIPIQLDTRALEDVGLGPDEPVTVNIRGVSLRSALRLMLRQVQLTYVIANEVLMITTPDEAETHLVTCVYDVRDLTSAGKDATSLKQLVNVIHSTVATETWAENGGGEAEIRSMSSGVLVISQTQAVHDEIRQLLRAIRAADPPAPAAASADRAVPGPDEVVTRYYMLPGNDREDSERWGHQAIRLIRALVPDQQWEGAVVDGGPVLLAVLPDRLVVRHRQSVQQQVRDVLMDIGVVPPPRGPAEVRSRRGGFGGGGFGGGGAFSSPPVEENPFGFE